MRSSLLLFMALALAAQTKPGGVEGVVTNAVSGEPLARAHVSLRSDTNRYGAVSTAEGKFSIAGIEAGVYRVNAEHAGFLTFAERFQVRPDVTTREYKIALAPEATIAGRVLDPDGHPVEDVTIMASTNSVAGLAYSNDRGEFRIDHLAAGKYRLKAAVPRTTLPPEIRTDGTREKHLEDTWHAGVLTREEASLVEVSAGGEVTGIDIRLIAAPMVHISGVVTGAPAGITPRVEVEPIPLDGTLRPAAVDGSRFVVWNAPRGKQRITARAGQLSSASEVVDVAGADREGIELNLMAPFPVSGRIEWDGTPPQERKELVLELRPPTRRRRGVTLKVEADGTFQAPAVEPERYEIAVLRADPPVYVKAAYLGARECEGGILDVAHGAGAAVTVRLSTAVATISGVVSDAKGPAEGVGVALAIEGGPERRTESGKGGAYAFPGLAPGVYRLWTVEANAEKVELREGEKVVKDLKAR
jgi:hypothetical protein